MKKELERLDFAYELVDGKFIVTIPNRRLDVESNVNDIAEEIGRLYGYHNLISTVPMTPVRRGQYVGDVKYRKMISKRLRSLGLNEVKTYTLTSPDMASTFDYEGKVRKVLPNPMSVDKSVIRTSLLQSLVNVYNYNKARKVSDVMIYEISKTYDASYQEDSKVAGLLCGNYLTSSWSNSVKVDFYVVKGIVENLLDYMGFENRYTFEVSQINDLHPGVSAKILLDKNVIGVIGKVHPKTLKDNVYVFEISMNALMSKVKALKYKAAPKYPGMEKDMAFVLDKSITAGEVIQTIRRSGGKLLTNISVFDVYTGENVGENEKSLAFKLQYMDPTRTLTEEEVMASFNKIVEKVTSSHNAKLRDK